ncbi:MAG: hypothetical protein J3R72DRAFT_497922 [Linnemannia gamsii]|nr:MAG: hypothetical protein J3R72DRAFT_497922 [Linnemannia gamsii]
MRFHSQKVVTPQSFATPVTLHRKKDENPPREYYGNNGPFNNQQQQQQAAANTKGGNKKGQPVPAARTAAGGMLAAGVASGAPPAATVVDTTLIAPCGGGVRNKQTLFQNRTKQIYIANEEERQKNEIELAPWVLDGNDSQKNWTGELEGGQEASYAVFVKTEDGFKVIPVDKWYKFNRKQGNTTLTVEEAEEQMQKSKQQNHNNRWMMRFKNKKSEDDKEGGEKNISSHDEDEAKDRKANHSKHGDVDEMDFDEVWPDDEEMPDDLPGFSDPRNKQRPHLDPDEDGDGEEARERLSATGKAVKKALRKFEKSPAYASDDDKDPYASDKDSSDSDSNNIDKQKEEESGTVAGGSTPDLPKYQAKAKAPATAKTRKSRAQAKVRATATAKVNAKTLKTKSTIPTPKNATAGAQPAAKGRASASDSSSYAVRESSPLVSLTGCAGTPRVPDKKRKERDESSQDLSEEYPKKATRVSKASASSEAASHTTANYDANLITEAEVIAYIKSGPRVTTRDLVHELKKTLRKDVRNKTILATIIKKVAIVQNGVLLMKDGF